VNNMEFIDLKAQYQYLKEDIDKGIQNVIAKTNFIMGDEVKEFEKELAAYVGVKHAISCSDGTSALQLIYMVNKIGAGDAVFCPDMTFIASVEPAVMLGAEPIFCDIDPVSYNICPESLERQIHAVIKEGVYRPRAIVAVDFIGNPADYDALEQIAKKYNLLLIEDAAQGIGATYNGKKCGSFGDIAATSFFPSKPLGCYGDGGAVFTNDDETAALLNSIKVHGKGSSKYDNQRIGVNSRLDTIQATVLSVKLKKLDEEMAKRQIIAKRYDDAFREIFQIPVIDSKSTSSYAQYALLARDKQQRDDCMAVLKENNIPTIVYYPNPMHKMKVFEGCFMGEETLKHTSDYADRTFSVPFSAYLTEEDQNKVISVLKSAF